MYLKVRNGSSNIPNLIASKRRAALIKSWRSVAGRPRNLRRCSTFDLYKPLVCQPLEQSDQVTLTAVRLDIVLTHENVSNLLYGFGFLDEGPDSCTHIIQSVICSSLQV